MITFNAIPTAQRVPGVFAEFDASRAQQTSPALNYRGLIIGQKTSAGAWTANTVNKASSVDQVIAGAGRGSMLHRQAQAYFANNRVTEVWFLVLGDNGAGVAASATVTITGPATGAGTISLYIGGVRVPVAVASADVQNTIAAAINAAINAATDLPVTSTVTTNVVTITCRHKGEVGNQIDLRVNYQDGEATPAGLTVALSAAALGSGTTNPTLTTAIAALGDAWYHAWAFPYLDSTSLSAIEAELDSRDGPMRMIDGVAFTAKSDTVANMGTLGNARNSRFVSITATNQSPTPAFEIAAGELGKVLESVAADAGRPFQTLPLAGVLPPVETAQNTKTERNTLLYDGISTLNVVGGTVLIERLITTYKTTAASSPDTSYLDVRTRFVLQFLRFSLRSQLGARYARHKLADDSTRFGAGQFVVTPAIIKGEVLTWFRNMEELGHLQHYDEFKSLLQVEIDPNDPNRVNMRLPVDFVNFLAVIGAQIAFQL